MFIAQTDSTNTLMRQLVLEGRAPEFIRTDYQTAGRGQQSNSWESAAGENLLCSLLLHNTMIPVQDQFRLSVIAAVALHRVILCEIPDEQLTIKWPNDLYYGDRKLAGMLTENDIVCGMIARSIIGIGLNVNQTTWQSDAPNPVSMCQITGKQYDVANLMDRLWASVKTVLGWPPHKQWEYYRAHLYRREGFWPFVEREVDLQPTMNAEADAENQFRARIEELTPRGEIVLRDTDGKQRIYHFKQVRYVI